MKYLNNIIEQDHRNVKRLTNPGLGFGSFWTARRTLAGYEAMAMMWKGLVRNIDGAEMPMLETWKQLSLSNAAAVQLICHDHTGDIAQARQ